MNGSTRIVALLALVQALFIGQFARAENESGPACADKAALYATDKGLQVWVMRRGSMERDNPLRPLSRDRLIVLQVAVNGRLASAYGPDFGNLRQGAAPQQLEREGAGQILWDAGLAELPAAIRVVAEDGSVLFGPIRFGGCVDPPQVAAPAPRRSDTKTGPDRRAGPDRRTGGATGDPSRLPQGALPSLSIPRNADNSR